MSHAEEGKLLAGISHANIWDRDYKILGMNLVSAGACWPSI